MTCLAGRESHLGERPRDVKSLGGRSRWLSLLGGLASLRPTNGPGHEPTEVLGWVVLPRTGEVPEGQFVAEIEGRSMEPHVRSGSVCLFGHADAPPHRGRIVLVSHGSLVDDVTGGSFALKRIKSIRRLRDGRTRVVLESLNPDVAPLTIETHEDDELRVVAELVRVLVPGS